MFRVFASLIVVLGASSAAIAASDSDRDFCLRERVSDYPALTYPVLMACTRVLADRGIGQAERARAYYSRAKAHMAVTGWGRAFADYTEAIRHAPEFVEAYVARAEISMSQRDFDDALADCNSAVRISPQWVRGHYCRALAYRGKGDTRRTLSALRRAIELSPELRFFVERLPKQ